MKKLAIIFLSLFMAIGTFAQSKANTQSTTKIANDSTLIKIHDMLDDIDYRIMDLIDSNSTLLKISTTSFC